MNTHHATLSDQKLYHLCKLYGEQTKKWRQKFAGLLPEVNRRRLYEKKGFQSIFEFAKKMAGLSEEQVRLALNLEKKLDNKPMLKNLFTSGEVSINKLARVTSVINNENEEFWANQVKILPQKALETLVRDERAHQKETESSQSENRNGLQKGFFEEEVLRAQTSIQEKKQEGRLARKEDVAKLELTNKITKRLLEVKEKGFDLNELLEELLDKREEEIKEEKEKIVQVMNFEQSGKENPSSHKPSRYIPVKIRTLLQKEFGTKCSIPTCQNQSEVIHHSQRFSLVHLHDPRYLAPMCKAHHTIAHSIDLKFQEKRAQKLLNNQQTAFLHGL